MEPRQPKTPDPDYKCWEEHGMRVRRHATFEVPLEDVKHILSEEVVEALSEYVETVEFHPYTEDSDA